MPAPPTNLDFATAGATPGSAAAWTATRVSTRTGYGTYGTTGGLRRRAEMFTQFVTGQEEYRFEGREAGDLVVGLYYDADGTTRDQTAERFEFWYPGMDKYVTGPRSAGQVEVGMYNFTLVPAYDGDPVERFDTSWFTGQDVYRFTGREPGDVTAGTYDGVSAERFGAWYTNLTADYRAVRAGGDVTAGTYDGALANAAERFRAVKGSASWTATNGSTIFNATGHAFNVGDPIVLTIASGAAPLSNGQTVYVAATNPGVAFTVALTQGGGAVTITSDGAGTATGDPEQCWPTE